MKKGGEKMRNMCKKLGFVGSLFVILLALSVAAWAFDPIPVSEYKKWPNNWGRWGPDDEVGTCNFNTPDKIVAAARLVKKGKIIPCSWTMKPNSYPLWGQRVGIERFMNYSGADVVNRDKPGLFYSDEIIKVGSHSGAHVDPLIHLWWGDKAYNGYPVKDIITHDNGTIKASANAYLPHCAQRGVLLDVARFKGVDYLGDKYLITPKDLDDCAKWANVKVKKGDAILIRTGFMKHWSEKIIKSGGSLRWNATVDGEPGPGGDCIAWIQNKEIGLIGVDNIAVEHIVPVEEKWNKIYKVPLIPLHVATLSMLGNPMQELLDLEELSKDCAEDGVYEFMYIWPPLNFWNATGGLISPVAIK